MLPVDAVQRQESGESLPRPSRCCSSTTTGFFCSVDHSLGATPLEVPEGGGYQSGTIQAGAWEDVVLLTQEGATSNQLGRRSPPAVAAVESQNQFLTEVDTDAAQVCSITDC